MDYRKLLEKLENKIDFQNDHLASIDKTLVKQNQSLEHHIMRTELLEKEFRPVRKFVYMLQGGIAFITILATLVGIYAVFR